MSLRKTIETAVITALTPLKKLALGGSASGYLKALEYYAGEFEGAGPDVIDMVRESVMGRSPCILVATGRGAYDEKDVRRRRAVLSIDLHIIIVSNCFRSLAARTQGNVSLTDDPGIWTILENVRAKLHGTDLSVDGLGPIVPLSEDPVITGKDLFVWRQAYRLTCDAQDEIDTSGDETLTQIDSRINLPDEEAEDENPIVSLETAVEG